MDLIDDFKEMLGNDIEEILRFSDDSNPEWEDPSHKKKRDTSKMHS